MASLAPHPPTPQRSHISPKPSPTRQSSSQPQPALPPSSYGQSYNMSFESSQGPPQSHSQPAPGYTQSFPGAQPEMNGPPSLAGYSRSFGEGHDAGRGYQGRPQIYTAVYSGVSVYEMEIQGVACMRRRSDGWLNATQILKVAGVDKGKRTKVLEKEILTGEHEKVQGGYGKYQGTWISYRRGREFCHQYGVEDILRPLLDYDVTADGSGGQGQHETPTKEQAMAANRKRFYNTSIDQPRPTNGPANGTFFQNISPNASVALAAINKAGRLNSPVSSGLRRSSSQQEGWQFASQQSAATDGSMNNESKYDSGYGTQANGEPPRKRMRADSRDGNATPTLAIDASMRSASPTEPNESFVYDAAMMQEHLNGNGDPVAKAPLPAPTTDEQHERMGLILDLFADTERTDYSSHPALMHLSGEELNLPLDASANSALHWAATLAKVPLLRLLIRKGANVFRGNAAGQSPLISAVLVNNCWERSCFPELLELLAPLIEVRDLQGRTILHHVAVSSGIKGRAPSSKYYLEALLEFLVRIGTHPNNSSNVSGSGAAQAAAAAVANIQAHQGNGDSATTAPTFSNIQSSKGAVSLVRFLSHIVNARDKAGNTALNLVARIGNRSIIQQLLEIHADPSLPNNKGVSAKDFGVGIRSDDQLHSNGGLASQQSKDDLAATQNQATQSTNVDGEEVDGEVAAVNQVEEMGQDIITSITAMFTQNLATHKATIQARTEQIEHLNQQIQEFSNLQRQDLEELHRVKERVRLRADRQSRVKNLRRAVSEKRAAKEQRQTQQQHSTDGAAPEDAEPAWLESLIDSPTLAPLFDCSDTIDPDALSADQREALTTALPDISTLKRHLNAYITQNHSLQRRADDLRSRSAELGATYRKVVALCTGVKENRVEGCLEGLVAAVESERIAEGEVGRVREFLRRVDGDGGELS